VTHIPPENWRDITAHRTVKFDIYGFGIMLWELFTEQTAFTEGWFLCHCNSFSGRFAAAANIALFSFFLQKNFSGTETSWQSNPTGCVGLSILLTNGHRDTVIFFVIVYSSYNNFYIVFNVF